MSVVETDDHAAWRARTTSRLEAPELTFDVPELLGFWRHVVVEVGCRTPKALEQGAAPEPWLTGAIRGALGHGLLRAMAGGPRREAVRAAQARTLLFDTLAFVRPGLEVPKPVVLQVDVAGPQAIVRLVVFGFAIAWHDVFARALLDALAGGIRLKAEGGFRVQWQALDGRWTQQERISAPPPGVERVRLDFVTPLSDERPAERREAKPIEPADVVFAALERVSGMARFQGARLRTNWSAWRDLSRRLVYERVELSGAGAAHRSSRQPGNAHEMRGVRGGFDIVRPPEDLLALLALAETTHAGARGAFGFGRFRLLAYP